MTRKHYIKLAKQLLERRATINRNIPESIPTLLAFNRGIDAAIAEMCEAMLEDNSSFDTEKFLRASGTIK